MHVDASDVQALALGGAFLATGGGGDTLIGEITTGVALEQFGPVALIDVQTLADDALVLAVGGAGSPTIMQEKPSAGDEPRAALETLERYLGRPADALIAFEAGGMNALLPLALAAERKLPVVDADGMGRAFPELQMESFSIYGIQATPLAMATELDNRVLIEHASSPEVAEQLVRQFAVAAGGGHCVSAEHPMSGAEVKRVAVLGTLSLCRHIGAALLKHGPRIDTFVASLEALLAPTHYGEVRLLFRGKVVDLSRRVEGGYDLGLLQIAAFGAAETVEIRIKNEYLTAHCDGQPLALTPDLICILDNETGRPITAETIRYGQRVTVLGIGAPALMRTPRALTVVAPRNFGFDFDYVPIEELPRPSERR
ncbi:MAG: DUF917 domain-containing protein [Pseudomonadota bacterium]